jgi:hypothetical protein
MCKRGLFVLSAAVVTVIAVMVSAPTMGLAGSLEPAAAPGPTMKTLDEIPPTWSQTLSCDSTSNCPRFQIVFGGEGVLDKETGLVWEKSPSTTAVNWLTAITLTCKNRTAGNRKGWRLPTTEELMSLVDPSVLPPNRALPSGHPFTNVQLSFYWSANSFYSDDTVAEGVFFNNKGDVGTYSRTGLHYVWCVRGGQGDAGRTGL